MKRRELILASAGLLLPALSRGAQPCPPPQVSVSGGSTATTNCTIVAPAPPPPAGSGYSTNFAATENPLSEGGIWVNGAQAGGQWTNVQTTTNKAFAAAFVGASPPSRYKDSLAHLSTAFRTFNANQFVQGTVFRAAGYAPSSGHEIEHLLRFSITSGVARGYEVMFGLGGSNGYINIVRWNGPLGSYTLHNVLGEGGTTISNLVDGDVIRSQIVGNIITVTKNGSTTLASIDIRGFTDLGTTVWASGQPGIGFWVDAANVLASYGWKAIAFGDL